MSASDSLAPRPRAESLPVRIVRTLLPLLIIGLGMFGAIAIYGLAPRHSPRRSSNYHPW